MWVLGGQRDDTGASNPAWLGKGYMINQSKSGVKTNSDYDFAFGRSSITLDGHKQTEYPPMLGNKEGLDQKDHLDNKIVESDL